MSTPQQPDPLRQAAELLQRFTAGERICASGGIERDAAAVIAAVGYAQARETRRIADILAALVEAADRNEGSQDLAESVRIYGGRQ